MLILLLDLLDPPAVERFRTALADAPFADGKRTSFGAARRVKNNEQLHTDHPISKELGTQVLKSLANNALFRAAALPHTIMPPRFCRYRPGMTYGEHLDLPVFNTPSRPLRTDLSLTLWLSPPDSYDGGELVLTTPTGKRRIKGEAGKAVVYTSALVHEVAPVTRGERIVGISWIQSIIADENERQILFDLASLANELGQRGLEKHARTAHHVHHRLTRKWADC